MNLKSEIRNQKSEINNPTLSLCMIVKDEETLLPGCLESVKDYVDEIIIVDTGSTDSTVEIAKKYNAKIYHHPWENSFSKARNYSLKYATCDWFLILDADEEIDNEDACKLKEIIRDEDSSAFSLPVFNKPKGGKFVSVFNSPRIFKNHLGFHYEGIVHNQMKYSGIIKNVNIRLYHYGYDLDEEQRKKKFIRSSTLLKEQISEDPHNPLPHHYLAVAYLNRDKYTESIQEALEAIRLFEHKNIKSTLMLLTHYTASVAFYRKEDLCNAETYALKALSLCSDYPDAYRTLSSIYLRQRKYSKCMSVTEKHLGLLKSIESNPVTALDIAYDLQGRMEAFSRLAILNFEQGKELEGNSALKLAINSADYEWEPYLAIGEYFLGQKDLNLAERFLDKGHDINAGNKEFLSRLGRLYYLRNDYGRAETLFKQVLEIDQFHIEALKGLGILCLDTKRFEEAGVLLYKALDKVSDVEVYNNLGCLEDKRHSYEKSLHFFKKSLELGPENQVIIDNIKNIQRKLSKESKTKKYSKLEEVSLSLCMIVKNEETLLPGCLESVKDYVDEIIIVDTGSTDRTVEIAKKYNAKIYHHPWENSFSKARNYSLKYATCDWILILDADEEIDSEDACQLREIIKEENTTAFLLPVFNKPIGGELVSVFNSTRIFKNHLGFCFEGIVHNQMNYSGISKNVNIRIYHYGYNLDEEQMKNKFIRTSSLLIKQIRHEPDNPLPHHYLSVSYLDREKNDECIKEALEAIKLFEQHNNNEQVRLISYYTLSVALYRKKEYANAEKYCLKAVDLFSDYIDAHYILSSIYLRQKEYKKCVEATKKFLRLLKSLKTDPTRALRIPYNNINNAWRAISRLAIVYFEQHNVCDGFNALRDAVCNTDDKCGPYISTGKYLLEQKNLELAEMVLRKGLESYPDNKKMLYYLAEVYEESDVLDKELICFKKIIEVCPDETLALYRTGLIYMRQNRSSEAANTLKAVIDKDQKHIGALFNLSIIFEQIGDANLAIETYEKILEMEPKNAETLVRLGSIYLNEYNYDKAEKCFLNTLSLEKYLLESHLALSKIHIFLKDMEACVVNCDELLKLLCLPRNLIINNVSDLSNLYIRIGTALLEQQNKLLANCSFEIADLLGEGSSKEEASIAQVLQM